MVGIIPVDAILGSVLVSLGGRKGRIACKTSSVVSLCLSNPANLLIFGGEHNQLR